MSKRVRVRKDKSAVTGQLSFGECDEMCGGDDEVKGRQEVLTVSELTNLIKLAIVSYVPRRVHVSGEVSNLSKPSSGHIYFTLKDKDSQINCVIWKSAVSKIKFSLENGLSVQVVGRVDIYPQRGQYQIYVERVKPAGMGELELAFRQLKDRLESAGLFDPDHKIPVPKYPFTIGVVTSPSGAAIQDILRTLENRWPVGRVLIFPVAVQGEWASDEIAEGVRFFNEHAEELGGIDVIIVARGGGSLEDLWAFNEEIVARAIYGSELPVITGVGHEIDITIADLAADLRAATPTAAAQLASPVLEEVQADLHTFQERMRNAISGKVAAEERHLQLLSERPMFRQPVMLLSVFSQRVDEAYQGLSNLLSESLTRRQVQLHRYELRLSKISPSVLLERSKSRLQHAGKSLRNSIAGRCRRNRVTVEHLQKRLASCDYRNVLNRGFAIVRRDRDSKLVTSSEMVHPEDNIVTEFSDGKVRSKVTG